MKRNVCASLTKIEDSSIQDFKEGAVYSDEIKAAVRYGYLYRKEAEKGTSSDEYQRFDYRLGEASEFLLWLANIIIGGVVWDVLKIVAKKLYQKAVRSSKKFDKRTEDILTDEAQLKEFYVYVLEFHEHRMAVDEKQLSYIKEEIVADCIGEAVGKLYERENRFPTEGEYIEIVKESKERAEELT